MHKLDVQHNKLKFFRSDPFYKKFLDWKASGNGFEFDKCFSLNFGYHDDQLSIPQISMTPSSNTKLNYDSPSCCIFVIVGGKFLTMIGKIMEKVNSVTKDAGTRPMAVFLMSYNINENIIVNLNYDYAYYGYGSFQNHFNKYVEYKSTPVMV